MLKNGSSVSDESITTLLQHEAVHSCDFRRPDAIISTVSILFRDGYPRRRQRALLIVIQAAAYSPPEFYADFTSRVWITYHVHLHPIRDSSLTASKRRWWGLRSPSPPVLLRNGGGPGMGRDGRTTRDGGVLWTGQSLLATALIHLHLGRRT